MPKEIVSESGNRLFVVGVDMENRSPEDIARDAAMQINDIFDVLLQSGAYSSLPEEKSKDKNY